MLLVRLAGILVLGALPHVAWAQGWADASRSGDYRKAANILHAIVTDPDFVIGSDDPEPARYLSLLYARGLGVERDPIAACALAHLSEDATQTAAPKFASDPPAYDAALRAGERFTREQCDALSRSDHETAMASLGCFAFGMPEETLAVGDHFVRVGRRGIRMADTTDEPRNDLMCPALVARIRSTSIQPPDDAAPGVDARHFVELFFWRAGRDARTGKRSFGLAWVAYEVWQNKVIRCPVDEVLELADAWPDPAAPRDLDTRITFEMLRSGHVRWRIAGAPPKRGWLLLPEERKEP